MNTEAELIIFLIVFPCYGHWLLVCFCTVLCHEMALTLPSILSLPWSHLGIENFLGQAVPCPCGILAELGLEPNKMLMGENMRVSGLCLSFIPTGRIPQASTSLV